MTGPNILRKLCGVVIGIAVFTFLAGIPEAVLGQGTQDIEGERLAQTGMKFLSLSVDPRAAALGDAVTAAEQGNSTAMFYNPGTMAHMEQDFHVAFGQVQWLGDIDYNAGSVAFQPGGGTYGVIGVSVVAVDYGALEKTVRSGASQQGFEELGTYSPSSFAVGLGYARSLTDRFAIGGNVKFARQSLGESILSRAVNGGTNDTKEYQKGTLVFDFGGVYRTGFESLNFAFSARNFASELTYAEESFELPLEFRLGLSMDILDLTAMEGDQHSLRVMVDGRRPRDYSEQLNVGGEYTFMNTFSLRAGYTVPTDRQGINLGTGVNVSVGQISFAVDYAYATFSTFTNVNRFALKFGL